MRVSLIVLLAAALAILLQVVGHFAGGASLWGVHHYAFLPGAWLALGAGLGLLFFLWFAFGRFPAVPLPVWLLYLAVLTVGGAVFWFGRETTYFLGDGTLLIEGIRRGHLLWLNEPGALFGVLYLNRFTGAPDPATTFAVVSVAAGMIYLGMSLYLARLLTGDPGGRVLFFCLLAFSGLTRLFYGYVETYPLMAAMVCIYLVLAFRYLRGHGSPLVLTLAATLATGVHFTAALVFPSLIYLLWTGNGSSTPRRLRLATLLVPVAVGILGLVAIGARIDPVAVYGGYLDKLLPLAGDGNTRIPYGLLSLAHFQDLLQEQLILGPFGALLAVVLLVLGGRRLDRDVRLLLWVGIPWWALSFFYNREIGAARDWDLFSVAAIPFVMVTGVFLVRHLGASSGSRLARAAMGLVLAACLFHTLPWVALGRDTGRSLMHFAAIFSNNSNTAPFARAYAWEEIGMYYMRHRRLPDAREAWRTAVDADTTNGRVAGLYAGLLIETGEAEEAERVLELALRRTPYRAFLHFQLGTLYHERGDNDRARMSFEYALERNPNLEEAYVGLSVVERTTNRMRDAEATLRRGLERLPGSPPLLAQLGIVLQTRGDTTGAIAAYQQTLDGNPGDLTSTYNLGLLFLNSGKPEAARPYFERVLGNQPKDVEAWINLGVSLEAVGQANAALTAFGRARAVNPYRPEPYFNSVQIHLRRKENAPARELLEAFLERDATSQYGRLAQQLLEQLPPS